MLMGSRSFNPALKIHFVFPQKSALFFHYIVYIMGVKAATT